MSIADALRRKQPFVVVFSTPAYCSSAACGPPLDIVQEVAKRSPDLTFIHVEVYDLDDPSKRELVPAVEEWGLPSEPWVFVVDSQGRLVAKYEGTVGEEELRKELSKLTS